MVAGVLRKLNQLDERYLGRLFLAEGVRQVELQAVRAPLPRRARLPEQALPLSLE